MKKFFLLAFLLSFACSIFAQKKENIQLALKYYQNKEYEKASELYEKIYKASSFSKIYFNYYIRCLIEIKDFKKAEKLVKKQIKKNKNTSIYYVDLGYLYKIQNKYDKANENYELAIKKVASKNKEITKLANIFIGKQELKWAEKTYLAGREKLFNPLTFNYELANIYTYQRDYQKMLDQYLTLLESRPSYLKVVQNRLQSLVISKENQEMRQILKKSLLIKIRQNTHLTVFNELLIWTYIQNKEFNQAFIQAKALDKRQKEGGERLMQLANLASNHKDYDVAFKIYETVIEKGHNNAFYEDAKVQKLETLYNKILAEGKNSSLKEKINLEQFFLQTINELGRNQKTVKIMRKLAHLQAFYLNKSKEAIKILEKAILIRNINQSDLSYCKIELADIQLLKGDIWEATLIYAQVESDNKNNPIGYQAKFKKAKLAYYTGDFQWAKAQLNVLKASTSKLIANDAFELALLIDDNIALDDTSELAMRMFARADFLLLQHKNDLAFLTMDSILTQFSYHSLNDEILLKKAKIMQKTGNYEQAIIFLEQIIKDYSFDILVDNATFILAEIYDKQLNNIEKAKELYRKMITDYPDSIYTNSARQRFRELRGDGISN